MMPAWRCRRAMQLMVSCEASSKAPGGAEGVREGALQGVLAWRCRRAMQLMLSCEERHKTQRTKQQGSKRVLRSASCSFGAADRL